MPLTQKNAQWNNVVYPVWCKRVQAPKTWCSLNADELLIGFNTNISHILHWIVISHFPVATSKDLISLIINLYMCSPPGGGGREEDYPFRTYNLSLLPSTLFRSTWLKLQKSQQRLAQHLEECSKTTNMKKYIQGLKQITYFLSTLWHGAWFPSPLKGRPPKVKGTFAILAHDSTQILGSTTSSTTNSLTNLSLEQVQKHLGSWGRKSKWHWVSNDPVTRQFHNLCKLTASIICCLRQRSHLLYCWPALHSVSGLCWEQVSIRGGVCVDKERW